MMNVTWVSPILLFDVIPDRRSLVFLKTLIEVSVCVADIICISQITLELIHNALLIPLV